MKPKFVPLFASIFLSMLKVSIGVLGASEVLAADGLYSFYQSFLALKAVFHKQAATGSRSVRKSFWIVGLLVSKIMILGTCDVLFYSFVRIAKAAQGLLMRPSPYALYAALLSIVINEMLYRHGPYSSSDGKNAEEDKLTESFRMSVVVSVLALVATITARKLTLYGDSVATILIAVTILAPRAVNLLRVNWRLAADWIFYRPHHAEGTQAS